MGEDVLTSHDASHHHVRRANASETEKGRAPFAEVRGHMSVEEKIALGRELIRRKDAMRHGHWLPWLEAEGIAPSRARDCMKLARRAAAAHRMAAFS